MSAKPPREAMMYEKAADGSVKCGLCGHECTIQPGQTGLCRVRQNQGGRLVSLNYEALVAVHVDPIEKKPLFHFLPGTRSLSIAAAGCNFQCAFCQNWQISQAPRRGQDISGQRTSPEQLVAAARNNGCSSISYTYTEPTVFYELAYDTAMLAGGQGIRNCFVSNGYMMPQTVREISRCLDAINVDLKAFRDETYRKVMKARLAPVLRCLKELVRCKVWLEVTTLVVPGMNDSEAELKELAAFIANELSPDVPWHVSRFHGDYQMGDIPATPVATLHRAVQIGKQAGLRYVYAGNIPGDDNENTHCPQCGQLLIQRVGFAVRANNLQEGACPKCRTAIAGVWK